MRLAWERVLVAWAWPCQNVLVRLARFFCQSCCLAGLQYAVVEVVLVNPGFLVCGVGFLVLQHFIQCLSNLGDWSEAL